MNRKTDRDSPTCSPASEKAHLPVTGFPLSYLQKIPRLSRIPS